jgi:signal transduction histidine kinase
MFKLNAPEYRLLKNISNDLTKVFKGGRKTIDMLLMSMKDKVAADDVKEYSVQECIEEALSEYCMSKAQRQRITFKRENDFKFIGSKHFFKHVLFNLMQNAFKYAGKDATIEIWLEGNKLYFKDNGSGIAPEKLPHIFDKFHTTSRTGTGIGLAFCKMVMENLGGEIKCKSEPGKYTEFILVFPKLDR